MSGASPLKDFARYTSLNVLGMIALSCYILADTFFVSLGLGADGLAALNLAIPIYNFIHGSGLMIGMGGGTRYSILQSQGNRREANKVFTHVLYLAAVLAAMAAAFHSPLWRRWGPKPWVMKQVSWSVMKCARYVIFSEGRPQMGAAHSGVLGILS